MIRIKFFLAVILFVFTGLQVSAQKKQKEQVLFTYGKNKVYLSEFERGFMKNRDLEKKKTSAEELDEYLDLYVRFRLKVHEAYTLRMDTGAAFKREMQTYRPQLMRPFLTDKTINDKLIDEAYERLKYEINASHILILLPADASPADTLKAYQKIQAIREELIAQKGLTFETSAVKNSEDPSVYDNKGNLGYFTAFQMVYPFETMAYNTPVGEISQVFRTDFGYHIVKVYDKRPSKGEVKVAQIFIRTNPQPDDSEVAETKSRIDGIYQMLKDGVPFEELVEKYSEDMVSKRYKGELNGFASTSRAYPQEFINTAFSLKANGDVSAPFRTANGWYIIKRINHYPLPTAEQMRQNIIMKLSRDSRSYQNTVAVAERIKLLYKFKEDKKVLESFIGYVSDSMFMMKNWNLDANPSMASSKMFFLEKRAYTVKDFATYLTDYYKPSEQAGKRNAIEKMYSYFVVNSCMKYHEDSMHRTEPEFRALYKEYMDGILLFNLSEEKVWGKGRKDSAGLATFYEANKEKYKWGNRFEVVMFNFSDKSLQPIMEELIRSGMSPDSILVKMNKSNPLAVTGQTGKFEKGMRQETDTLFTLMDKGVIQSMPYLIVVPNTKYANYYTLVWVKQYMPAGYKKLEEARGAVQSDYQTYLEEQWIKDLKVKYPVKINAKVFNAYKTKVTS